MISGIGRIIQYERLEGKIEGIEEATKKAHKEKMKNAKAMLKHLNIDIVTKEFELTDDEVEELKEDSQV